MRTALPSYFGHQGVLVRTHARSVGGKTKLDWWAECSCGFASQRSWRMSSAETSFLHHLRDVVDGVA